MMTQHSQRERHHTTNDTVGIDKYVSRTVVGSKKATWQRLNWNCPRSVPTSKVERFLHPTIATDGFLSRPVFAFFRHFLFLFSVSSLVRLGFFSFLFDLFLLNPSPADVENMVSFQ